MAEKLTIPKIKKRKGQGALVVVTCYDATFARLLEQAGVDLVLVGDSLGNVIQGHANTIPVTMDEMVYHCRCVARGLSATHLVGDLPFMSYQASEEQAILNAGRLMKEGCVESVKLEGGRRHAALVGRLTEIGVPVMGHIGLTPQSFHGFGGYKLQGKTLAAEKALKEDARLLQEAGAYSIVLEGLPGDLAGELTESLSIPTIGIGAGPHCDGQVLVLYDLLGLDERFNPRFLKKYLNLSQEVLGAVAAFGAEVRQGTFPGPEHYLHSARKSDE